MGCGAGPALIRQMLRQVVRPAIFTLFPQRLNEIPNLHRMHRRPGSDLLHDGVILPGEVVVFGEHGPCSCDAGDSVKARRKPSPVPIALCDPAIEVDRQEAGYRCKGYGVGGAGHLLSDNMASIIAVNAWDV